MSSKILRLRDVMERTTLSDTTIYRRMKENTFPRHFRLGTNTVGWLEEDIDAWIARCAGIPNTEHKE